MPGAQTTAATPGVNRLRLQARIVEMAPLRYTPAGLPALDVQLEHESTQDEAGMPRQVHALVRAVALAAVAERLVHQHIGSELGFTGFVASPRRGRQLVFHIQDFQQI